MNGEKASNLAPDEGFCHPQGTEPRSAEEMAKRNVVVETYAGVWNVYKHPKPQGIELADWI